MNKIIKLSIFVCAIALSNFTHAQNYTWDKLKVFSAATHVRGAASDEELQALKWLKAEYQALGYKAEVQPFTFKAKGKTYKSNNLEVVLKGQSAKTIVVGAHYDGITGTGSKGFIDNASGAIALLGVAKQLRSKPLPYTVKLVHFWAEEIGIYGSEAYVNNKENDLNNVIGMINLDTIIGGDYLYIHSAESKAYLCKKIIQSNYSVNPQLREKLISLSKSLNLKDGYKVHPQNNSYKEGQTGSWSDHYPFACKGIPVAYLESTNFFINGKDGYDGVTIHQPRIDFWNKW
ncbi:M28 family peptidase [Shewanella sp. 202IG2-18]|uniref:M28 family metallopeptidase n=1 Tax=Parashewanella hymeniacidonis TaxID=2807618 RepID=UPI0019606F8B|nr:M28 family peptidase [Parashewanella hymeniacidonis]MBM7074580.1 M28 family peptidase [Parashewanella hymeniacidonis]